MNIRKRIKRCCSFENIFKAVLLCILIALIVIAETSNADHIKKSNFGICHSPDSRYYSRIEKFDSYHSLSECINPDNRTSRTNDEQIPAYKRTFFGSSWIDVDQDCQNTRQESLISNATGPVYYATPKKCRVVRGRWISPYTNDILTDASKVDIDHIVPLKFAHLRGAYKWSYEMRRKFANDPINLYAVELSLNRSKGARGPTEWLPPLNQCQYMLRFLRISLAYGIQITEDEARLFNSTCKK